MSLLPATDAQDQNSSSANEETFRTSRTRVSKACDACRSRKSRCNGADPCEGCRLNKRNCVYENIEPSKQEKSIIHLNKTVDTMDKRLHDIQRAVERLSIPQTLSHPIQPNHRTNHFSAEELYRLSKSYVENVHVLHPIFDKPQQMCNEFIGDPAVRQGIINSCLRNVHVLFIFALGSCQPIADDTKHSSTILGKVYYSYGKNILRYKLGEGNIPVAQALTLAALYTSQHGMLEDSLAHLFNARGIYADVARNSTCISAEAKRSFWIYQDLARSLSDCFNLASSYPFPKSCDASLLEGNVGGFPERVYWIKVTLRILLDALCGFARPYFLTREIDEEDLYALGSVANKQIEMLEEWRLNLISRLAWDDTEPPSTDPLIASLRAEYYEGIAKLLRPYVGYALHANVHSTGNELSKGQQRILKVLLDWEKNALSSIVCFDRVGAAPDSTYEMYQKTDGSPVMLSNPVSTLHAEFKIVFLCRVIRSSKIYPLIAVQTKLTDTIMDTLRRRTMKKLSEFCPSRGILSRDLEALNRLWSSGDSVPLVELVRAYELV